MRSLRGYERIGVLECIKTTVLGAFGSEDRLAFDERSACLNKIINHHNVSSLHNAFLHMHVPVVVCRAFVSAYFELHNFLAFHSDLGANHFRVIVEEVVKTLP